MVFLTSVEDVQPFLNRESLETDLDSLQKAELFLIAQYGSLEVRSTMKKQEVKDKVRVYLGFKKDSNDSVDDDLGSGAAADEEDESSNKGGKKVPSETGDCELEKLRLQFQLRQLEWAERAKEREHERELKEKEREREERAKELEERRRKEEREHEREREERVREQREREREHEITLARLKNDQTSTDSTNNFDIIKYIKLVPKFSEDDVGKFFVSFEKVAKQLKWPKEQWAIMLQVVLTGKAQVAYSALSADDSSDYEKVKKAVLRSYELVPEAYRQKFRNLRKDDGQTYMEFARQKERLFDDWCQSRNVEDLDALKELILLEEFKNCINKEIKTHLEEMQVENLETAAKLSDEYSLTHKQLRVEPRRPFSPPTKRKLSNSQSYNTGRANNGNARVLTCFHCGKNGHVKASCYKYLQGGKSQVKGTMLVKTRESESGILAESLSAVRGPDSFEKDLEDFKWYVSSGSVSFPSSSEKVEVKILRDTGGSQSMLLEAVLPKGVVVEGRESVLVGGFPDSIVPSPLVNVILDSSLVKGPVKVALVKTLPIKGVDFVLGNDLAHNRVSTDPIVVYKPEVEKDNCNFVDEVLPVNVVTRSKGKIALEEQDLNISDLFDNCDRIIPSEEEISNKTQLEETEWTRKAFIIEQKEDAEVTNLRSLVERGVKEGDKYIIENDLLFRKFAPLDSSTTDIWKSKRQIVVPLKYRDVILNKAHENLFSGHLGIDKTYKKIVSHFFWPGMKKDVKRHCKTCHRCQITGKPNQTVPKAPLLPIPSIGEPFQHILIDIVGPLPKSTGGVEYILTIMDRISRYPEAIPLKSITSPVIVKHLVDFFSRYGLPMSIQSDQGSNFTSRHFKDQMKAFGIQHIVSTPYHPESQGAIERFHQTLKSMIKKYCIDNVSAWAKNLPFLLFAIRSAPNDSLGFSPFQLIFGHQVRGPLEVLGEVLQGGEKGVNMLNWVSDSREKLFAAWELAKENLVQSQQKMKEVFDIRTKQRTFKEGDEVLVLLPLAGNQLKAKFTGPYVISRKFNYLNYVVSMPDRKKKQLLCHINMLKPYFSRTPKPVLISDTIIQSEQPSDFEPVVWSGTNSKVLASFESKIYHLNHKQKSEIKNVIESFPSVVRDAPGRTNLVTHDVDVGESDPIKQHPYRLNPAKTQIVKSQVEYLLQHHLVKPSHSPWSSPVVLVPKSDNDFRLCFDYRKLNQVTKTDTYPLPRVEDCIDKIGNAKYLTKIDLMKGYYQVPLSERAKAMSAFVTPDGLFECEVMPFGMKNAASTFQRMMNMVIKGMKGIVVYIDDVIIFSETWEEHLGQLKMFFMALEKANLVINLSKSEFGHAKVVYLGHEVGFGKVAPKSSNIQAILDFPVPKNRKNVMQFLGLAGYYRRFVANFSDIAYPLSNLLKKNIPFVWNQECETSFNKLKAVMINYPVLKSPDFSVPFQLSIDASDVGVGAVLEQKDSSGGHPVAYFSRKLNEHQKRYSTIEKETLALVLALSHFDVYVSSNIGNLIVYSDHNPLKFLYKFRNKNQRLTRWSLLLQEYNLEIRHVKGKDNIIPDVLSRV